MRERRFILRERKRRFCGAIHSVNWANISVLSQVIHSVNERKTVQTNMISFVSHGDKTL